MDEKAQELAAQIQKLVQEAGYDLFSKVIVNSNGTLGAETLLVKKEVIEPPVEDIKG